MCLQLHEFLLHDEVVQVYTVKYIGDIKNGKTEAST